MTRAAALPDEGDGVPCVGLSRERWSTGPNARVGGSEDRKFWKLMGFQLWGECYESQLISGCRGVKVSLMSVYESEGK